MSDRPDPKQLLKPTDEELNQNAIESAMKLASVAVGNTAGVVDAIAQMVFKRGEGARFRRVQECLDWIMDRLDERGERKQAEENMKDNTDFDDMFAKMAEPIANATNPDKRERLRQLLKNSTLIPPGDSSWQTSMFCLELIKQIEPEGLYALAVVAAAHRANRIACWIPGASPGRWVEITSDQEIGEEVPSDGEWSQATRYHEILVELSLKQLSEQEHAIFNHERGSQAVTIDGQRESSDRYTLTPTGLMLVKWTIEDF